MKSPTSSLTPDADKLLNAILLAFREKFPWGADYPEEQFLSAARTLLDVGAIRIMQDGDRMWVGLQGRDFK